MVMSTLPGALAAPIAIVALAWCGSAAAQAPAGGTVRGVVMDKEFGSPLAGATVTVLNNKARTTTRENGTYTLEGLPAGPHTLVFTKDGYVREVRANVMVREGQLVDVDAQLAGEFEDMDEFVVQDMDLGPVDTADDRLIAPLDMAPVEYLPPIDFKLRLDSPQLLDIIGVEMISKSGASDAAAALLLVPGATLQDGKYAVVRGLPDRYVSTLMDGIRLPTADPDKRAVKLDQFPAAIISSIQVSKNFTPDQQGEASGGAVNIALKDIPDQAFFQVKAQIGGNSQVHDNEFLTYRGGTLDFWGGNDVLKLQPQLAGQSWPNNPTGTQLGNPPTIYKWSVAAGNRWDLGDDVTFGAFGNFFYDQDASAFDRGKLDSLQQNGAGTPLVPEQFGAGTDYKTELFNVTQGTTSVQWGGMGAVGLETENNLIAAKYLYTSLSENQAVRLIDNRGKEYFYPGYNPNDPSSPGYYDLTAAPWNRLETLDYSQLGTQSFILNGEHVLSFLDPGAGASKPGEIAFGAPTIDWRFAVSKATEDQPDQTQFSATWLPEVPIPPPPFFPPIIVIPPQWGAYPPTQNTFVGWAQHISYQNEESSIQGALNATLPFLQWNDREGYIKAGTFVDSVSRSYRQDTWSNNGDPNQSYSSNWNQPWSQAFPSQDHPINQSQTDISYDGAQDVLAFYGMIDMPVSETVNLIGGLRYEGTHMSTTVIPDEFALWIDTETETLLDFNGPNIWDADFTENRVLPMLGVNWNIQEDLIFRGAFAQTLARPNFYELVPVLQYEYIGGPVFIGNPGLEMSALNNYDMRLDWLPFEDWLISGSMFYKTIEDPIPYAQRSTAGLTYTTALNFPSGRLFGLELESRITMGPILGDEWNDFGVGANFTWMDSKVVLPEIDRQNLATYGVYQTSQPMTATPEYLVNLNATYDNEDTGTQVGLFYTLKGDSLVSGDNTSGAVLTPAIYQLSYGTLNFTVSQQVFQGFRLALQVKNLLNPIIKTEYRSPDGFTGLNSQYTSGISWSVSASYQVSF